MSTLNAASAAVRRPLPKRKNGKKLKVSTVLIHTGLLLLVAFNLFPLYWMVTFSLKTNEEILGIGQAANLVGLPKHYEWNNYTRALNTGNGDMGRYFLNSLIVAVAAITITIIAAFMATYAMTRLVWKGRKMMNKFFMLGLTIPIHASLIPVYVILSRLDLLDKHVSLIIPYAAFSLSMAILISVGFMGDIPYDLDEAAFLDGCGVWGIFFRVIAPLMMPAIATVGIYTFLQCWNELLFATVFVSKGKYVTLPVGISQLVGQHTTDWGPIGAALTIATLPTMIVYALLSKRIQAGFIAGAVKG